MKENAEAILGFIFGMILFLAIYPFLLFVEMYSAGYDFTRSYFGDFIKGVIEEYYNARR